MNLTQSQQLEFYALYKIAVKGPCDTPEPSFFYPTERRKWNAYNDLTQTGISSAQAQFNYVSTDLWCQLAQENDVPAMEVMLDNDYDILNAADDDGQTALHWATDRNATNVLDFLQKFLSRLDVNKQNVDGDTALHLANDQTTWNLLLEKYRIDPNILNHDG